MPFKSQLLDMLQALDPEHLSEITPETTPSSEGQNSPQAQLNLESQTYQVEYGSQVWNFYLINTERGCQQVAKLLSDAERYYLDTEFQTFRNTTILSLLQISAGREIFVIDCYELGPLESIKHCLSRPHVEWILHDARADIPLLCDFFEIPPPARIFDTQIAWGFQHPQAQIGLAQLVHFKLRLHVDKSLQTSQFLKRPLPLEWVEYAAKDIPPLIALMDLFLQELSPEALRGARSQSYERVIAAHPHLEEYVPQEMGHSDRQTEGSQASPRDSIMSGLESSLSDTPSHPQFFQDLHEFRSQLWNLEPPQLQRLRAMKQWRANLAPDSIITQFFPSRHLWIKIARICPRTIQDLKGLQGMNTRWVDAHGSQLITALNQAVVNTPVKWSNDPEDPWSIQYRPEPLLDSRSAKKLLLIWLESLVIGCALRLKIAPEYLLTSGQIKELNWPLEWLEEEVPSLEAIWTLLCDQLPLLTQGWRAELFAPLLREMILNAELPILITESEDSRRCPL